MKYLITLCMLSIQKVICYTGNVVIRTTNSTDDAALGIVGGFNAEKGQYPWFARAVDEKEEPMFCGGTLITSDFILTAGHCTSAELHAYEIGSLCHEEKTNCKQKNERRRVKNILVHPKYEQRADGIRYDFALIKLRGPSSIKPAALDLNGFQSSNTYEAGRELWAVGYGKIDFHDSNFPKHLQHVQVNYWSQEDCQQSFADEGMKVHYTMMCALGTSTPATDACNGDSGGALYDKKKDKVVGVTSWGLGCASEYPGVYSRVTSVRWWIMQKLCTMSRDRKLLYFCNNKAVKKTKDKKKRQIMKTTRIRNRNKNVMEKNNNK